MRIKIITTISVLAILAAIATLLFMTKDSTFAVLDPKGVVAEQQRDLIVIATLLMLLIVIPVFIMTFTIAWKYRAGNSKADYKPDWDHNRTAETIWWSLPLIIIAILSVIIWKSSHDLDPYKPLNSEIRPLTIQVVALQYKWLFIYPEQDIATVNYIQFPAGRPVNFKITADAPMNSFWIPQLGGQVYAMSGMETKLHLMANQPGIFDGSSANLSGEGFASMRFKAEATTDSDFKEWVSSIKAANRRALSLAEYADLVKPGISETPIIYADSENNLYDTIIMKYMMPTDEPVKKGGADDDNRHHH